MSMAAVKQMVDGAQEIQETLGQTVNRLAALPLLEYEQVRDAEGERLKVRVSVLDAEVQKVRDSRDDREDKGGMFPVVNPWPEPIEGAVLLTEIFETVKRFIVCDRETAIAVSLWIAFTWLIDHVQVAPLAVITAPEKRCGKSQLLNFVGKLSCRPMVASNISSAAVFRVIEAYNPTLLMDEADSFMRENEELRGVINSGHTRQSAYVVRTVGDDHEPVQFSTWGAKAISGIGHLADTLMDRAIVLELRRKLPNEKVERLRHAEAGLFKTLSSKLARWAEDNGHKVGCSRPLLPEALNDRAQDNWEPLLAIADAAGGEWPKLARDAALKISGVDDAVSLSAELLSDIKEIFLRCGADRISTADLLRGLNEDELAPWATYNRGKPMAPRQLAKRLGEYGLKPSTIRIGLATPKGFLRSDFEDVFARYLMSPGNTPSQSATPQQIDRNPMLSAVSSVADNPQRCGNEYQSATPKPLEENTCCAVADKKGVSGENITEVTL